jgi:hypothetical protein
LDGDLDRGLEEPLGGGDTQQVRLTGPNRQSLPAAAPAPAIGWPLGMRITMAPRRPPSPWRPWPHCRGGRPRPGPGPRSVPGPWSGRSRPEPATAGPARTSPRWTAPCIGSSITSSLALDACWPDRTRGRTSRDRPEAGSAGPPRGRSLRSRRPGPSVVGEAGPIRETDAAVACWLPSGR